MPKAEAPAPNTVDEPERIEGAKPEPSKLAGEKLHRSMIDVMRDVLKAQPKRRVRVRSDGDVPVQINGYSFLIQPNVWVEVPEQVAEMLDDGGYL
jgi:hypothetical protein